MVNDTFYKMFKHRKVTPILTLFIGFFLRAWQLPLNRFHQDEALYAYFARLIASQQNVWLQTPLLDKPPLNYYLTGATIGLFWIDPKNPVLAEFIARLPHLFAATVSIALLYQLSKRLFNLDAALIISGLFALAPFAISFATTLFAETLLTCVLLAGLLAGTHQKLGWLGVWLATAVALKPTALYFFPLVFGVLGIYLSSQPLKQTIWKSLRQFGAAFAAGIVLLLAWQLLRPDAAPFWAAGADTYNPQRFIRPDEIQARLLTLGALWQHQFGSIGLMIASTPIILWGLLKPRQRPITKTLTLFLVTFVIGYCAWHWLIAFNIRDRYFLPLTPLVCLLFGWGLYQLMQSISDNGSSRYLSPIIMTSVFVVFGIAGIQAANAQHPVGGDHGAYDGIEQIAQELRGTPTGTVLYDLGLDWHWRFYLYESDVFIAWQPGPDNIAEDVDVHARNDPNPRYVVLLELQTEQELIRSLAAVNYQIDLVLAPQTRFGTTSLRLYRISPTP